MAAFSRGFALVGQAAFHHGGQQGLQRGTHARPGGNPSLHQVGTVHSQLAHGVAAGLGQLVHAALKGGHIGTAGGNLRRVGVGVQIGIFQRAEPPQENRPAAVQQL